MDSWIYKYFSNTQQNKICLKSWLIHDLGACDLNARTVFCRSFHLKKRPNYRKKPIDFLWNKQNTKLTVESTDGSGRINESMCWRTTAAAGKVTASSRWRLIGLLWRSTRSLIDPGKRGAAGTRPKQFKPTHIYREQNTKTEKKPPYKYIK